MLDDVMLHRWLWVVVVRTCILHAASQPEVCLLLYMQ
jgi:hypothetical protein